MRQHILAERLRRQRLSAPVGTSEAYCALFRLLQPVSPIFFSRPGDPPSLVHRATFDDRTLTAELREGRTMVKGRFLGGTIGYVLEEDLETYANAFRRPLAKMTWTQRRVYDALQSAGPLTPRQLSEETDLLNKEIMPALHRLQEAFLVYEDQLTTDWERGWYLFASEWPEITISDDRREAAIATVLLRFLQAHVFATFEQFRDWSGLAVKELRQALEGLEAAGRIVPRTVTGLGDGWLHAGDVVLPEAPLAPSVFMLHKADPLVRAHAGELKQRFAGLEVLQYLLIDGIFLGAVVGHWRIGPHDVDDIALTLPAEERAARRAEILHAVAWGYHPPFSRVVRYDGGDIA